MLYDKKGYRVEFPINFIYTGNTKKVQTVHIILHSPNEITIVRVNSRLARYEIF